MSSIIEDVMARKIFNSRGQETIEVDIVTTDGLEALLPLEEPAKAKPRWFPILKVEWMRP